jgi:ATP-dependent Zn protease
MKPPSKRLQAIAYHEAGHAVIACHYHRAVEHVTIVPEKDSLGHVQQGHSSAKIRPDIDWNNKTEKWIEREIEITLAGPIAESEFTGREVKIEGTDRKTAIDLAWRMYEGKVLTAYWNFMTEKTRAVVKSPIVWAQIEAVAHALVDRRKLNGSQIRSICREVFMGPAK